MPCDFANFSNSGSERHRARGAKPPSPSQWSRDGAICFTVGDEFGLTLPLFRDAMYPLMRKIPCDVLPSWSAIAMKSARAEAFSALHPFCWSLVEMALCSSLYLICMVLVSFG